MDLADLKTGEKEWLFSEDAFVIIFRGIKILVTLEELKAKFEDL